MASSLSLAAAAPAMADGEDEASPHRLSLVAGTAFERKRGEDKEVGMIGVAYAYEFRERLSAGAFVEGMGGDAARDTAAGLLLHWQPTGGWSIFAGPGLEHTDAGNEVLFRVGTGYGFALAENWSLGPEATYDVISGGKRTFTLALALSRSF